MKLCLRTVKLLVTLAVKFAPRAQVKKVYDFLRRKKMKKITKAIIPAAGLGTRMLPVSAAVC